MKRYRFGFQACALILVFLVPFLGGLAQAASPSLPDLVPLPNPSYQYGGPAAFCDLQSLPNNVRMLRVRVGNKSLADAKESTTRVTFGSRVVNMKTPGIKAGGDTLILVPVPAECFNPDCSFIIVVNADGTVAEATTRNNTANGSCVG